MNDPYKILGVPQNASDAQIKEAYRELAKKYHPDKYINNPLADLAAEKMREINEAYDYLTKNKGQSGSSNSGGYTNTGGYGYGFGSGASGGQFANIRRMINENKLDDAERALGSVTVRNAEWHFLMGVVKQKRGWLDMAYQHFTRAVQLDPYNVEYRNALNAMNMNRGTYTNMGNGYGYNSSGQICNCDTCSSLLCADCCCEMMGGDLVPCC